MGMGIPIPMHTSSWEWTDWRAGVKPRITHTHTGVNRYEQVWTDVARQRTALRRLPLVNTTVSLPTNWILMNCSVASTRWHPDSALNEATFFPSRQGPQTQLNMWASVNKMYQSPVRIQLMIKCINKTCYLQEVITTILEISLYKVLVIVRC